MGYSPALQPNLKAFRAESDEDAIGVLRSGGVSPGEVDRIIYRWVIMRVVRIQPV